MNAYVLHSIGNLQYEEVEIPQIPAEDWCIVRVKAAGICSSDIPRIFTKGTYHFPTIPGHEFSGEVYSVGSTQYNEWIGKRVGIFPLIPCKKCIQCKNAHFEMCENYDYLGSRRDGGFAEYVAVPIWNLIEINDSIPFTTAAMLEPLSVALHAMNIAKIKEGDSVGIIGTGMIGISAAQWAKKIGASQVEVIGRNEDKRSLIENCGLDYYVSTAQDKDKTYDIVLEAVGTPTSVELSLNLSKPGGTIVLMGNPSGDILLSQNTYWRILRKQLTVKGTWNSAFNGACASDWTTTVKALQNGDIFVDSLITHCFKQQDLTLGIKLMKAHNTPYCKIMTTWND